jgi:hypothetical protein
MKLTFDDIDDIFAGHRFCEKDRTYDDQFYNPEMYFWNLQFYNTQDEVKAAGLSAGPMDGANPTLPLPSAVISDINNLDDYAFELADKALVTSTTSPWTKGWTLRPFHPKKPGNEAIKKTLIEAMKAAHLPGVKNGV